MPRKLKTESQCLGLMFFWSDHALERWNERFSGINKNLEFSTAKRVGKKTRKAIKTLTPVNSAKYLGNQFNGRYCLLSKSNIVFVIGSTGKGNEHAIVTVFHLHGDDLENLKCNKVEQPSNE